MFKLDRLLRFPVRADWRFLSHVPVPFKLSSIALKIKSQ
jgi:hypothetical protein